MCGLIHMPPISHTSTSAVTATMDGDVVLWDRTMGSVDGARRAVKACPHRLSIRRISHRWGDLHLQRRRERAR